VPGEAPYYLTGLVWGPARKQRGKKTVAPHAVAAKRDIDRAEQRHKIVPLEDAVALVRSGDTICTTGFVAAGTPDALLTGLERRFVETGEPQGTHAAFRGGAGGRQGGRAQPPRP
jgi:hypothetical protein